MAEPAEASPKPPLRHWQDLCPACKRRTVALAQLRINTQAAITRREAARG
jgi:hypothetical protein